MRRAPFRDPCAALRPPAESLWSRTAPPVVGIAILIAGFVYWWLVLTGAP